MTVSPFSAGLRCRCPRCGRGKLFQGLLTVAPVCTECGLDLKKEDSGDAAAVFVIFILGAAVVPVAILVETMFSPPEWVHLALWPPLIILGTLALLRPFKATAIALQYRHRSL